jgi:hypothetical protein
MKNREKKTFPNSIFERFVGGQKDESQGCQMVYFQTKNPNLGRF